MSEAIFDYFYAGEPLRYIHAKAFPNSLDYFYSGEAFGNVISLQTPSLYESGATIEMGVSVTANNQIFYSGGSLIKLVSCMSLDGSYSFSTGASLNLSLGVSLESPPSIVLDAFHLGANITDQYSLDVDILETYTLNVGVV